MNYKILEIGEIIESTDEVIGYDDKAWEPVPEHLVGRPVWSDWRCASNLKFRRKACFVLKVPIYL